MLEWLCYLARSSPGLPGCRRHVTRLAYKLSPTAYMDNMDSCAFVHNGF